MRHYTTPSTVPDTVRPQVWKDWQRFWRRLRSWSPLDRGLEFKAGTPLLVEGAQFSIRYEMKSGGFFLSLGHGGPEAWIRGHSAFGEGKPYVFADELQDALDSLVVCEIMAA